MHQGGAADTINKLGLPPASDALSPTARILQGAAVVDRQLLQQLPIRLPVQLFLLLRFDKVSSRNMSVTVMKDSGKYAPVA